jgi:purine-nucleoside phosphorylase
VVDGNPVLAFAGRVHAYEGWDLAEVVFGVRTAVLAGCRTVVLTNAAGGVGEGLSPGDLVVIRDHINLTGRTPLVGRNDERLGLQFPDMTEVYTAGLRERLEETAAELGEQLGSGVYAWLLGPAYETPAEVEMARRLGADLVGMSTVPEAIAARHMGARVVGISLVTNLAAGLSTTPLSHDEVQETATGARQRFSALLDAALPTLVP